MRPPVLITHIHGNSFPATSSPRARLLEVFQFLLPSQTISSFLSLRPTQTISFPASRASSDNLIPRVRRRGSPSLCPAHPEVRLEFFLLPSQVSHEPPLPSLDSSLPARASRPRSFFNQQFQTCVLKKHKLAQTEPTPETEAYHISERTDWILMAMDDNDANDFTFCKVDSQAENDHVESPKAIPDVNKITLEDNISVDKGLRSNVSFLDKSSSSFKSNESLVEAAGTNRDSLNGLEVQKSVLKKPAVRAKVPFEKGYSQMDWLKLTRTHPDLAGLKGRTNRRLITMDEVKKHKAEGSMWTVLKGRVYNISPYMKFHPGGADMLMKATGKDCTSLFNKYHAWVNAEFLLEKCLVGVLENDL